jgi:acetyl/propionyl-CoA carboxylase alpha subunit
MKIQREFVRDGKTVAVSAEPIDGDRWRVRVDGTVYEFHAVALGDGGVRLAPVGQEFERSFVAYGAPTGKQFMVRVNGRTHTLAAPAGRSGGVGGGADGTVRAPMTGTVLDVACAPGDTAGLPGVVASVAAKKGATVDQGAVLVVVEPTAATQTP